MSLVWNKCRRLNARMRVEQRFLRALILFDNVNIRAGLSYQVKVNNSRLLCVPREDGSEKVPAPHECPNHDTCDLLRD